MTAPPEAQEVLDFWFGPEMRERWFAKDEALDAQIRERFLHRYEAAASGALEPWAEAPEGLLALILLLDQFPRNMFRGTARMFATDAQAVVLTYQALEKAWDAAMEVDMRRFLYMPLMHSESLRDQERSVALFELYVDPYSAEYARRHLEIIKRFGRFPHRNAILERVSDEKEIAFLKEPGSSF